MAQTFSNAAGTDTETVPVGYPMQLIPGVPGQIADLQAAAIVSGTNETAARIPFGIPLVRNGSGVLPNSAQPMIAAGTLLGIHARTHATQIGPRTGPGAGYAEGATVGGQVNILKQGSIYLPVMANVVPGNPLRYHKSGASVGLWGTAASVGNTLLLAAGQFEIQRGASNGGLILVYFNTPAVITVTAD